jgi:putative transposase
MSNSQATLEDRALAAWANRRRLPGEAARRLLTVTEALTLSCLVALGRLREAGHTGRLLADNKRLRMENAELRSQCLILRSRLECIPARHRPHYTPEVRFQILEHMRAFLLSVEETARRVLVTPQTLYNWLRDLALHPAARTIGLLLRPVPPIRRYGNVLRRLVRHMKHLGFGGDRQIAATLARFGWKPSRRSVARFGKERAAPPPVGPQRSPRPTTVQGLYPNHLWLADITRIPTVFPFLHFHLTLVLDAFSRLPLKAALSCFEPPAQAVLGLVQDAIREHGKPRHFVSDRGSQFTADVFRAALEAWGIKQRLGALYRHGSIAMIERCFKTLKGELGLPSWKPWNLADLERRLLPALVRYAYCRPHSALSGRVPVEAFFGIQDQRPLANLAPRGRDGDPDDDCPFQIAFLDPDSQRLPVLIPAAA